MCILSALFVYYRAKLGYGLLSGDYSKPVPDPGEENGAAEPRVSRQNQSYWIQKKYPSLMLELSLRSEWAYSTTNDDSHNWEILLLWLCFQGDQIGIAPQMFKALVGRGHPEFSTNRQQDAQEFLLHFINMVEVKYHSHCIFLFVCLFVFWPFFNIIG